MLKLEGCLAQHQSQPNMVGTSTDAVTLSPFNLEREERRENRRKAKEMRVTDKQRRYGLLLALSSAFDVVISGFMLCVAFAHAYLDNGVSLYCLGIQALSHGLSSCLLAVRFFDEWRQPEDAPAGPQEGLLTSRRRLHLQREKCLSFFMGFVMLVSSMALIIKALRKWMFWDRWYMDHIGMDKDAVFATIFLAWYGVVVYTFQAILRGAAGVVLKRRVVKYSVVASMVSLSYLFVLGVAATFEEEWSWKAEPIAAIVLAAATIAEGTRLIYTHLGDVDLRLELDSLA
eukprot:CAMPEP_0117550214 /NCGR_PEP_ID=MMETSP0784-20121206/48565_1 /TAXON_ID=39447 /ORGANISM="" /LENGTH=286 /DNA_ID=CAMNT_0005347225 /DNA_START=142 /DNA_END=1002 /DNA_ORIENTATION=-